MKTKVILPIVAIGMIALAGCSSQAVPSAGVIGHPKSLRVGASAPDIPFTSSDGSNTTFSKIRKPFAIVAFTSAPGESCCLLQPDLVALADSFKHGRITVAQIALPTDQCPHGSGCVETCKLDKLQLISLCDADRIAWQAFKEPKPGTVFLINDSGRIESVSDMNNLDVLVRKANKLSGQLDWQEAQDRG